MTETGRPATGEQVVVTRRSLAWLAADTGTARIVDRLGLDW
jgi:hypothetical protein